MSQLSAGDIGCTVKLKDVRTGNTLNGKGSEHRFNFIKYPNPKFTRAVRAVNEAETEKMMAALTRLRQEDPTWVVEQSKELRQVLVHGQGEFHLRTLNGAWKTSTRFKSSFTNSASLIAKPSLRLRVPTIATRNNPGGAGQFW